MTHCHRLGSPSRRARISASAAAVWLLLWACPALQASSQAAPPPSRGDRLMSPLGLLPASFTGQVGGQAWQLDLLAMGRWQLRRGGTDSLGGYALEGDRLSLQRPGEAPIELRLRPDGSLRLPGGATLKRQADAAPFEPRLVLAGLFTHLADASRLVLCADGRALPVQMAGDYLALERAYTAARPAPGAPVWVQLEASIAPRPAMEAGRPPVQTLVVHRFDRADAQARCAGPRADRPLTGTEWRLVWLAGVATPPARAALRFDGARVAGSDGCNRLMGPAAVKGAVLTFGPLVGTEMACAQGQAEADAFGAALSRVRRMVVRGEMLGLMDGSGAVVMWLRAQE